MNKNFQILNQVLCQAILEPKAKEGYYVVRIFTSTVA